MHRVVLLDRSSIQAIFRAPSFAHEWREHQETRAAEVVERLEGASMAITNKVPIRADALARLPGLRFIAVCATGTDNVEVAACRAQGVVVSNVPSYARESVAEHTLALVLALSRNLAAYRESIARREWQASSTFCLPRHPIRDLEGSVIGIVGYGAIGRRTAELCRAFGMEVRVAERRDRDPPREGRSAFHRVLEESDVLSLHAPLGPETRRMIGRDEIARMKPGALLINTARGDLVDLEALLDALERGHLGGAGIDVLPEEPPSRSHPILEVSLPNLIITPHVAWASKRTQQRLADIVIDNLEAFARGDPKNTVT